MTNRHGPDPDRINDISFATRRLTIDVPDPTDAPRLYELVGGADREAICRTLLWDGPDSIEDVEEWIVRDRTQPFNEFGFHWVIRYATGEISGIQGGIIGSIGTRPLRSPGRADVGYWLGRAYWGQGIMTEALRALIALGFSQLNYHKIEADVYADNVRGRRLVEAAGLKFEGLLRHTTFKSGEWKDAAYYGLLHDEWEPSEL